ncbi:NAD(P)H-binding protein [Actinoplanes sp. NPDC051470]|uniref:NAD(P)-dependent oxidoreductase n=1 Tax=unclassified Actinoplanes TaxID=2626549 RepID=UPI0034122D2E
MAVVILGATGGTGRQLVRQAEDRGLEVRALARSLGADVHAGLSEVIGPDDVVISALGVTRRSEAGTLTAGARAVIAAKPRHIIWLGAMGTGPSAASVSAFTRRILRVGFGAEYGDKVTADTAILDAGGTVVHSGPLSDKPDDTRVTLRPPASMRRQFFPAGAPRATIARLMLDEAVEPRGGVLAVFAASGRDAARWADARTVR